MSDRGTYALEMNNVTKQSGFQTPLRDISMHVPAGSIYALIGPDTGAKRLLLQVIGHLVAPTEGELLYSSIPDSSFHHRPVGLYLKESGFIPEYSLYQNFSRIGSYLNMKDRKEQIDEIFKLFGLRKYARKKVSACSPKVLHIAGIAMAFFGWPDLVLLDDPFLRLEHDEIDSLKNVILHIKEDHHVAILVSCQKAREIEDMADCFGIFIDGQLVEEVGVNEINAFAQQEMHIRVDQKKKALSLLKDYGASMNLDWIVIPDPSVSTSEVFSILMKKKIGIYEIVLKELVKEDYFKRFTKQAKGNIY